VEGISKWRRVSKVSIFKRLNIKKQKFGFVRFQSVQIAKELEKILDEFGSGIGELMLTKLNTTGKKNKKAMK